MEKSLAYNSVCRRDILCGTNGAATSQAVPRLPHSTARGNGAVSDAFHDVSARKRVVNTQRELVQGAPKQAHAIDETLRQVMWRKLGSTGRKIATDYLSGTTFILTNDKSLFSLLRCRRFCGGFNPRQENDPDWWING